MGFREIPAQIITDQGEVVFGTERLPGLALIHQRVYGQGSDESSFAVQAAIRGFERFSDVRGDESAPKRI
jgi:hypothetical protein